MIKIGLQLKPNNDFKPLKRIVMLFNSFTFILFFAIVLVLHYMPFSWKTKKVNLLLASFLFYAMWNPPFILLLWTTIVMDFILGKKLYETKSLSKRKALVVVSVAVNLSMLGFFKYGEFLLENFIALANAVGVEFTPFKSDIVLPVGISFYTFQSLSYTIDMYKRKHEPEKSLLDFSLFVTFFPHLVAGPIVRPEVLTPQFKTPHQANRSQFITGLMLLSMGLFMKVVLADGLLSAPADMVFGAKQSVRSLDAWMGVLAFSGQIFFDFAGYSTCAIGVASTLGFSLPHNFKYPYAAAGFSDFWRRWHISLSTWLRDYLYISLGGNRKGEARTYLNLMITMLLGGLWHGASWTFIVWGALHGIFLCIEKLFTARQVVALNTEHRLLNETTMKDVKAASFVPAFLYNKKAKQVLLILFTFFLVNITWVFFRSADFSTAWRLLSSMFGADLTGTAILPTLDLITVSVISVSLLLTHYLMRNTTVLETVKKTKWWFTALVWAFLLAAIIVSQKSSGSFIYFQF